MKKGILLLFVITTVTANAQTLKDALYGGKLKTDSGTVIKKGDDLSTKIDTSRKKPVEPEKPKLTIATADTAAKKTTAANDATPVDNAAATKDNNKIWKQFIDSAISTLNAEVMSSKKVKKGEYFMMVDYAIELDGKVTINNVYPTPENKFLEEQVKERLSIDTPQLNPVLASNGKPRRVIKRHNFTLVKN
jgi:hypothetical protein